MHRHVRAIKPYEADSWDKKDTTLTDVYTFEISEPERNLNRDQKNWAVTYESPQEHPKEIVSV